jgi:hypothetical protein
MGGGHVSRPNFELPQLDTGHPMAEFYLFLENALSRSPAIALPGAYVAFHPPVGENPYADTIRGYCDFSNHAQPGYLEIFPPSVLHLGREELRVARGGAPAALLLTGEQSQTAVALQLIPPVLCPGESLPPVPESAASLSLRLTDEDVFAIDASPAQLGRVLLENTSRKRWVEHPKIEQWLRTALYAAQRAYHRGESQ